MLGCKTKRIGTTRDITTIWSRPQTSGLPVTDANVLKTAGPLTATAKESWLVSSSGGFGGPAKIKTSFDDI